MVNSPNVIQYSNGNKCSSVTHNKMDIKECILYWELIKNKKLKLKKLKNYFLINNKSNIYYLINKNKNRQNLRVRACLVEKPYI